jgi:hypothetical protein
MPYHCFISYASSDLGFAERLHRRLVAAGFSVWFDKVRLRPGCNWHREIESGCEESKVVVPVLTPRWKGSEWTRFETYGAEFLVPLLFEGTFEDVATPPLTRFQAHTIDVTQETEGQWAALYLKQRTNTDSSPLPYTDAFVAQNSPQPYLSLGGLAVLEPD